MRTETYSTRKASAIILVVALAALTIWQASAAAQEPKTTPPAPPQAAGGSKQADGSPLRVVPITGSGTANTIPVFTQTHVIGNSIVSQSGNGITVKGSATATSFTGNGAALTNVNASTLGGLGSSSFAQTGVSNTFAGDQTINGNLNLTGSVNSTLTLQGNLTDPLGQQGANVIGGFGGNASYPGNSIAAGVIGATIGGGGGAYESSAAPQRPVRKPRPGQADEPEEPAQPPNTGIVSGANMVQYVSDWATIAGGLLNTASASYSSIGGGFQNTASGTASTVGGGDYNLASGSQSTVGGGTSNSATLDNATVAGGLSNSAGNIGATVGGGANNSATGQYSTVAGGCYNGAPGNGATVGGGGWDEVHSTCTAFYLAFNTASGDDSTVSGGTGNIASGLGSVVLGGMNNLAAGEYSFAAGQFASANYTSSFVWGDGGGGNSVTATYDTAPEQFVARAAGGFFFYTNDASGSPSGATLPLGSGSWSSLSDRNAKANFSPVNAPALLEKLAAMPVSTWNYKSQAESIRHLGPMAQDFRAAFGLGEDDKHISTVDADGVALAGVQALYQSVVELKQSLLDRDHEISELKARLSQLEAATGNR